MRRAQLDEALPTIARFCGLGLTVILTLALLAGVDYVQVAPGFVPAAGLLLYKKVRDGAHEIKESNGG